ncbi:MAG: DUF418 domain-containing protein [Cyclobacteriaceae bacterium]|nr:DUF418 domain-containing protein [Cyclobacteriaceae bacterium]
MSELTQPLGPVSAKERIDSLDVLRGVALLGILLMNITGFGLVFMAYGDPTVLGGAEGWNLRVWVMNNMFFEGTMRAMFSMLFGVGMVLMTSRMEERGGGIEVADIYYRRTIWLFLFGIIHAYLLLWAGEILYSYGLFGLFLFPFRKTSPKKLIVAVIVLMLCGVALQSYQYSKNMGYYENFQQAEKYSEGEEIPEEIKEGKESWEGILKSSKPDQEKIQKDVDAMHQGYFDLVLHLAPLNRLVQTVFRYDYDPWDVLPMMLLGIALYRLKVITAELSYKSYLIMIVVGYGIGLSINYYETMTILNGSFSVPSFLKAGLTYPFGRIAVAFGHIGVVMIFCKSSFLVFLKTSLASVGKMALTNYIMHSVICAIVFTGVGFSMFGKLQRYELYYVVISIWLFQLIASPIWLRYFRFGPLEWMWRSLTYKKIQPFRRAT